MRCPDNHSAPAFRLLLCRSMNITRFISAAALIALAGAPLSAQTQTTTPQAPAQTSSQPPAPPGPAVQAPAGQPGSPRVDPSAATQPVPQGSAGPQGGSTATSGTTGTMGTTGTTGTTGAMGTTGT